MNLYSEVWISSVSLGHVCCILISCDVDVFKWRELPVLRATLPKFSKAHSGTFVVFLIFKNVYSLAVIRSPGIWNRALLLNTIPVPQKKYMYMQLPGSRTSCNQSAEKGGTGGGGGRSRARPAYWEGRRSVGIWQRWRKHDEGQRRVYSERDVRGSVANIVRKFLIHSNIV